MTVRVALLTYSTRPRGGVVHTLALAEALARPRRRRHRARRRARWRPRVLPPGRPGGVACGWRRWPTSTARPVGARVLRSIDALAASVDPGAYDVVHAQDCISANAVPGCGVIRTVHHLDHFTTPELARCHERAIVTPVAHVCVSPGRGRRAGRGVGHRRHRDPQRGRGRALRARPRRLTGDAVAARARWRATLGPGPVVLAVGGHRAPQGHARPGRGRAPAARPGAGRSAW